MEAMLPGSFETQYMIFGPVAIPILAQLPGR